MTAKANGSAFVPLADVPSIYVARKDKLRMFAVPLTTGGLCLVSPVKGLSDKLRESLATLGPVQFLFAPNHYHNLGLQEWSAAYPEAKLLAPSAAIARLQKQTELSFAPADALAAALPDHLSLLETEGLKSGEMWVRVQEGMRTAWIVVDAFCGPDMYGDGEGPQLLKPFPKFGLKDKAIYLSWLKDQVRRDQPAVVVPCHGSAVAHADLGEKLITLVDERL